MNTQETEAQPTSAPVTISWAERDKMCHIICAHPRGHGHPHDHIVDVIPPGEGFQGDRDEMDANARLIRAAFESSTKAKEMGYDPQAAVEALTNLIRAAEKVKKRGHHDTCDAVLMGSEYPCSCGWQEYADALDRALGSAEASDD